MGVCPICGAPVYKRRSKAGKVFYGCSNYPTCKFMSWEIPAPVLCPDCGHDMRVVKEDGAVRYVCNDRRCGKVILPSAEDAAKFSGDDK